MTEKTRSFSQYTISAMTDANIQEIAAIECAVSSSPWSVVDFKNEIKQKQTIGFIAKDCGNSVLGFIVARLLGDECEIFKIAVAKKFQRKGIGTCLFKAVFQIMSANKKYSIFLEVGKKNQGALALYKKLGFEEVYTREKYYAADGDAIVMSLTVS